MHTSDGQLAPKKMERKESELHLTFHAPKFTNWVKSSELVGEKTDRCQESVRKMFPGGTQIPISQNISFHMQHLTFYKSISPSNKTIPNFASVSFY